jgi:hypothetical protein
MLARIKNTGPLALLTAALGVPALLLACTAPSGDPASNKIPSPLGTGHRIREVTDPASPYHPANSASVEISGASFLWTDTFDETGNGKSKGTVYLQDLASTAPYSGVSLFAPTPANLALEPGDVIHLKGPYVEESSIGTAMFSNGQVLIQISKPVMAFDFEYFPPKAGSDWPPALIPAGDLDDWNKGRQWQSMLVTINNVTFADNLSNDGSGRYIAHITSDTSGPTISNELFDLNAWNQAAPTKIAKGATFKSITGIVTWFFNFHIAPRSPDDIVVQ